MYITLKIKYYTGLYLLNKKYINIKDKNKVNYLSFCLFLLYRNYYGLFFNKIRLKNKVFFLNFISNLNIKAYNLQIKAKRYKMYINKFFFFFKMNTSKYILLKLIKNLYIKKKKKEIYLITFNYKINLFIKNIIKKKKPNKYTKKGIFINKL